MRFNVNDHVWVRLTELGRQTYRDFWVRAAILTNTSNEPHEVDGELQLQLWELMAIYGPEVGNGLPLQFETTIRLDATQAAADYEKKLQAALLKEMSISAHLRIALAAIHRVVADAMLELSPQVQGRPDPRPVEQPKAGQHDQQDGRDHPDGRRQRDDGTDQPVDQREAKQHDDQLQHPAQVRAGSSDATFLQRVRQIAANHGQRAMLGRLRFRQQAEQTTAGEDALLEILELAERLEPTPPLVVPGAS